MSPSHTKAVVAASLGMTPKELAAEQACVAAPAVPLLM